MANTSSPLPNPLTEPELAVIKAAIVWAEVHYLDKNLDAAGEKLCDTVNAILGTVPWSEML